MRRKLPIYAICFVNLIYLAPSVAVSGLLSAFPGVPEPVLQLLLTLPNLMGIAGILGVPLLTRFFARKHLAVAGLSIYLFSGALSYVGRACLPVLLVGSAMMGIAYGMGSTLYPLLVSMYYEGEERRRVMGATAGIMQLGRIAVVLAGGVLADLHWYNVYLLFALNLIPLVLTIRLLPTDAVEGRREGQPGGGCEGWNVPAILRLSVIGFVFAVCYYVNVTQASLYIEGYGLGTAQLTGIVTAVASVLSGLLAFVFGPIYRRTGRYTFAWALGIMGGGYLLAGLQIGLLPAVLAVCAPAAGIALFNPCLMLELTETAPQKTLPGATALVLTVLNVGYFLSPYLVGAFVPLFPGEGAAAQFLAGGGLCLCAVVLCAAGELHRSTRVVK